LAEVTTLREAVAEMIEDGDSVALEGFTHLIPSAAAHESIHQERRNLTLIAASAKEVMMVLRQRLRSFVERLDYVTSVGHRRGGDSRAELGYPSGGPTTVITDLGVLRPDPVTKELTLVALHPGATIEGAREATGWELRVTEEVAATEPPTDEELEVLRELYARTAAARAESP
jgi:glutaconate CoA-transferase, subunit B